MAFYVDFLRAALDCALTPDVAIYQCYAVMRARSSGRRGARSGLLPHQVRSGRRPAACSPTGSCGTTSPAGTAGPQGHKPRRSRRLRNAPSGRRQGGATKRALGTVHPHETDGAHPPSYPLAHPPGGLLYEPFSGFRHSHHRRRDGPPRCYALELAPAFVDVAVLAMAAIRGQGGDIRGRRPLPSQRSRPSAASRLKAGETPMTVRTGPGRKRSRRSPPC